MFSRKYFNLVDSFKYLIIIFAGYYVLFFNFRTFHDNNKNFYNKSKMSPKLQATNPLLPYIDDETIVPTIQITLFLDDQSIKSNFENFDKATNEFDLYESLKIYSEIEKNNKEVNTKIFEEPEPLMVKKSFIKKSNKNFREFFPILMHNSNFKV